MDEVPKNPSATGLSKEERDEMSLELADALSGLPPAELSDRVRDAIRLRHMSIRTEQAYLSWFPAHRTC